MPTNSPINPLAVKQWPERPAERGKYYGVNDPIYKGVQLCVMTMETWADFGTLVKKLERTAQSLQGTVIQAEKKIQELQAANAALAAVHNDNLERLTNLRAAHREVLRAEIEPQLNIPKPVNFI